MYDSHAHAMAEQFDGDRSELITRASDAGVTGWVEIGTNVIGSAAALEFAKDHENIWATVGVHPCDIAGLSESSWTEIAKLVTQPKVVAIGEVGFDFNRGGSVVEQTAALERFFALAQAHNLPLVFHVRDGEINAHNELIAFLKKQQSTWQPRGVIHTFSGTPAQADEYLQLGLCLSFSGVVTFKNAGAVTEVAATVPTDRILIETDCPYLTPEPHRGERNEPAYVRHVAEKIAQLRNVSLEQIDSLTTNNTKNLFGIA